MTYQELLKKAESICIELDKEESVCKILLEHVTNLKSYQILTNIDTDVEDDVVTRYLEQLSKYTEENIPIQHVIGYECFYGYNFIVNKDVLIPRFETEELVSYVLQHYDEVFPDQKVEVVDIGTGSGCISITLDLEEQSFNVTATDISQDAINIAKQNQTNLGSNVEFLVGDMLEPLKGKKFDIIVSNPPYIPEEEYVDSLVKDNEPHLALFGGSDGLFFYDKILSGVEQIANEQYIIAFEHAYDKSTEIAALVHKYLKDVEVRSIKDLQNKDRFTIVIKR